MKIADQLTEKRVERVTVWRDFVTERLGREPRGFRDVSAFNAEGQPAVIRVSSVVNGKPFPTLFWLIDEEISLKIDRFEAAGWIARLQREVDASEDLQSQMRREHDAHKRLRSTFLTESERALLESAGMMAALSDRGIGGIKEPDRIRCLHTWYAAHMVEPNCIGAAVDQLMDSTEDFEWHLASGT